MRGSLGLQEAAKICFSIQVWGPGLKPRGRQLKQFLHQITLLKSHMFQPPLSCCKSLESPQSRVSLGSGALASVCGIRQGGDKEIGFEEHPTPALFLLCWQPHLWLFPYGCRASAGLSWWRQGTEFLKLKGDPPASPLSHTSTDVLASCSPAPQVINPGRC